MLGSTAAKRVRLTVEIPEHQQDAILKLLVQQETCEVVSIRRVQSGADRKRFAVPREDEPTPPTPVRLFPRKKTSGEVPPPAEQQPTVESGEEEDIDVRACTFCLQTPCISLSAFKPMGRGAARITNHTKRRNNYKWFWRTLKDCGLWENPTYLARKQDLGCMIDDVREVMPHCVIKDVRNRWPNPPHVPYQGHRRS
ncbi:uncharacterized protein [Acropora muricata]|uniref:uncharacterized protein n=1 Tax=Acropora muricata TaxID=159855 RepID=UPI0034E5D713